MWQLIGGLFSGICIEDQNSSGVMLDVSHSCSFLDMFSSQSDVVFSFVMLGDSTVA